MPTFIATIANMGHIIHFKERLPEAICCCLQTCNVDVVLLVIYCMYIPAFIVTSADISQLWVYLPELPTIRILPYFYGFSMSCTVVRT